MFSQDRRRARSVSDYADSLIARRRLPSNVRERSATSNQDDFAELLDLVRALDDLNLIAPDPPGTFPWRDDQVAIAPAPCRSAGTRPPAWRAWLISVGWHHAVTVSAVLVGVVVTLSTRGTAPALSADDLLKQSEAALEQLFGSGQGLYRVWDASHRVEEPDGRVTSWEGTIHEWIEGLQPPRLARRAIDSRGRLLWVLVADRDSHGQVRSRNYYTSHNPFEPRDLVTVDATPSEHRQALTAFGSEDRTALEQFFLPRYGPGVVGERAYNGAILGSAGGEQAEPVLSLMGALVDGVRMHRLEIFEPRRLWFSRTAKGALSASLVRYSQTRLISPLDRLTVQIVTKIVADSGQQSTISWTVRSGESRRLKSGDELAFTFDAPAGVPVRRALAREDLARMLPAFRTLQAERSSRTQSGSAAGTGIKRP